MARTALGKSSLWGTKARAGGWNRVPRTLSPEQWAEVESDCYLIGMVLSEAVARPLPGEATRRQLDEALALLDRVVTGHAATRAYHIRRAGLLERRGDREDAHRERERAAILPPSDAYDYLLLGQDQLRRGDWPAARVSFESALREQPNLLLARFLLASVELNSQPSRAAEARGELTFCLLQQASNPWLYLLRGVANGRVGQALMQSSAKTDQSLAETRFTEAEADFGEAWKRSQGDMLHDPDLRYGLLMNRGTMRQARGRLTDAVSDFQAAIALNPEPYEAHNSLAQAMRSLGRNKEAVASFDEAIKRQPRMAALYRGRCWPGSTARTCRQPSWSWHWATWRSRPAWSHSETVPRTTSSAAGGCWASIDRRTPWPRPTPR